jgi:hypothetical protein
MRVQAARLCIGLLFLSECPGDAPAATRFETAAPEEVTFRSGELLLHGFVYKPEGDGPFRSVLWNHGSERRPGWLPQLGPLFVKHRLCAFRSPSARAGPLTRTLHHGPAQSTRRRATGKKIDGLDGVTFRESDRGAQAENDYDLAPSRELDKELNQAGKPHKLVIFPPFGTAPQDGHELCIRGAGIWAPTVFSFLDDAMK